MGRIDRYSDRDREREIERWACVTSASGAVRAVTVGADIALTHDLAVDVLGVVGVDVACAAATVGYLVGRRHC